MASAAATRRDFVALILVHGEQMRSYPCWRARLEAIRWHVSSLRQASGGCSFQNRGSLASL